MIVVGITGGIGSGKGLATGFFRNRGAAIIDADEIARELMRPGSPVLAETVAAFGRDILRSDESLDRGALAARVFGDPAAVAKLNAITHPPIEEAIRGRVERLREAGTSKLACLVAPLLLEAGLRSAVDYVLVVIADEDERVRRVMARDGVSEEDVRKRMAAQLPPCEQTGEADWVVDTSRGRKDASRQLSAIWAELNG
jgi:dephospho-CoA kinase